MQSLKGLSLRVGAMLCGSAIIGAGIVTHPAAAQSVGAALKEFAITTCSNSTVCKEFKNNGSGAGLEGVGGSGNGVIGQSSSNSAVFATSNTGDGTQSFSNHNDGTNSGTGNPSLSAGRGRSGVWGHDDSTDGGTLNVGVAGSSTNGDGMSASSTNGVGIAASSQNTWAVTAATAASNARAMYVAALANGADGADINGGYIGVIGRAPAGSGLYPLVLTDSNATDLDFTDTSGNIYYHGSLISFIRTRTGSTAWSYGAQSASPSIEDTGSAQLVNGQAIVHLDTSFAQAIDNSQPYHVMLTPDGDTRGLYVASKSPTSFVVREVQGGHGTLTFDYHLYAATQGHAYTRMAITSGAQTAAMMPKAALSRPARIR